MSPRDQFERTVCDCPDCSRHCTSCPGMLIPGDMERMAEHLGVYPHIYLANGLLASPGAVVVVQGSICRIPTIVPAMASYGKAGKRCVFLNTDDTCKVHPVAPYGCAYFDDHMSGAEGDQRSKAALLSILRSASYQRVWGLLWQDGRRSLPPEEKRRDIPCPAGK